MFYNSYVLVITWMSVGRIKMRIRKPFPLMTNKYLKHPVYINDNTAQRIIVWGFKYDIFCLYIHIKQFATIQLYSLITNISLSQKGKSFESNSFRLRQNFWCNIDCILVDYRLLKMLIFRTQNYNIENQKYVRYLKIYQISYSTQKATIS